jgi:hypothetical protein
VKPGQVHAKVLLTDQDGRTVDSDLLRLIVTKRTGAPLNPLWIIVPVAVAVLLGLIGVLAVCRIQIRLSRRRSPEPPPDLAEAFPPAFGLCVWLYVDKEIVDFLEVVDGTAVEVGIDVVPGTEPKLRPARGQGLFRIRRGTEPGKASLFWAGDWKPFSLNDPVARKTYVGEDGQTVVVTESALSNPEPEHNTIPEGEVV